MVRLARRHLGPWLSHHLEHRGSAVLAPVCSFRDQRQGINCHYFSLISSVLIVIPTVVSHLSD